MPFDLSLIDDDLPTAPGVYLMMGDDDEVLYVGKATNIRVRVRQYFGRTSDTRYFVSMLGELLRDIQVLITSNEKEALILENELIKRHQPRFNVVLKDDKSFLHLRIDPNVQWPRIEIVRRPRRDGALYFGPYHSATKIRKTVKLVERHFQLRNCDDLSFRNRSRPCLQYQIKRCPGPCVLSVDEEEYKANVQQVSLFLRGRREELVSALTDKMRSAAHDLEYERAAQYRDQIEAVNQSLQSQEIVDLREIDKDVIAYYREGANLHVTVLVMRRGRLVGSRGFDLARQGVPDPEVLSTIMNLLYSGGHPIPDEVLLPIEPDSLAALSEHFSEIKGRRVRIKVPQRGSNLRLIEMARMNAEHSFFEARKEQARRDGVLARIKSTLSLQNMPNQIECFDISLFQGSSAVGSKVRFEAGVPARSRYRRYRIKEVSGTDDYAMMREVLTRRLKRGMNEADLPDLLVIDGGKGQLNVACAVLADLDISGVDVVALAKARVIDGLSDAKGGTVRSAERVFIPGVKNPIILNAHTDEFFLLTRLRDEAHRFAIQFHRKSRSNSTFTSTLLKVPGIGRRRERALLTHFGSLSKIRKASIEDLAEVDGINENLANQIHSFLRVDEV